LDRKLVAWHRGRRMRMIGPQPIGWVNTGMPLVLLGLLAAGLPWLLAPGESRSHLQVAVAVWAAAGLVLLAGAVIFAAIYGARGVGVVAALAAAPLATGLFFLRLSGFAALVWGPVLMLAWLGLAQRVERRRGEDRARER